MKTKTGAILLVSSVLAATASAQTPVPSPDPPYAIGERGPFWRTWQQIGQLTNYLTGATVDLVHGYTELGDGLCYVGDNGKWADAQDLVEITPAGAAAVHGQHKVYFSPNLNAAGAITMTTPSGEVFKSHPEGLYYVDAASGKSALIAGVQDCGGILVPPNTVVYSNAFGGLADVVYVYAKNGLEQNVVLKGAPPAPDLAYGFNAASTRLEVRTVFDELPLPQQHKPVVVRQSTNPQVPDLVDEILYFRDVWFPVGAAFAGPVAGAGASGQAAQIRMADSSDTNLVLTAKSLILGNQAAVLVESVDYQDLLPNLKTLNGAGLPATTSPDGLAVALQSSAPQKASPARVRSGFQLALAPYKPHGVVIDYTSLSGTAGNYTFTNGATYVISNSFSVGNGGGTATFQANTCIKYASNAYMLVSGPVSFPNANDVPATFTSVDDNLYGEIITNSTGYPYYAASKALSFYFESSSTTVRGSRFLWAQRALQYDGSSSQCYITHYINASKFQNSNAGIYENLPCSSISLSSDTKCSVVTPISVNAGSYSGSITTDCELNMVGTGFAGMNGGSGSDVNHPTPDTDGAIGPTNFVEILNEKIAVYDKSSGTQLAILGTGVFFTNTVNGTHYPTGDTGDPRVIYDQQSTCWVASAVDTVSQEIMFAYMPGTSPLPLTNWTRTTLFLGNTNTSDSPTLGVDSNGVYLSLLRFVRGTPPSITDNIVACLPKPGVYQGSNAMTILTNDLATWKVQVAINLDSSPIGSNAWCIFKGLPQTSPSYTNGSIYYRRIQWNNNTPASASWADSASTQLVASASAPEYFDFDANPGGDPGAPQKGGTNLVNFGFTGSRLHMAVIRNGYLWTCQHVGLTNTGAYAGDQYGSTVDRSGIQWWKLQLNSSGTPLTYGTSGIVYDSAASGPWWYYMPSLSVNWMDEMVLGFSGSNASNYITAFYTGRMKDGTMLSQPVAIQNGTGYFAFSTGQWGDYSFTTVDPVDNQTIWTIQEYGASTVPNYDWGDWIVSVKPGP